MPPSLPGRRPAARRPTRRAWPGPRSPGNGLRCRAADGEAVQAHLTGGVDLAEAQETVIVQPTPSALTFTFAVTRARGCAAPGAVDLVGDERVPGVAGRARQVVASRRAVPRPSTRDRVTAAYCSAEGRDARHVLGTAPLPADLGHHERQALRVWLGGPVLPSGGAVSDPGTRDTSGHRPVAPYAGHELGGTPGWLRCAWLRRGGSGREGNGRSGAGKGAPRTRPVPQASKEMPSPLAPFVTFEKASSHAASAAASSNREQPPVRRTNTINQRSLSGIGARPGRTRTQG